MPYSIESKFRSNSKDFGRIYTFYEQATDQALDLALNADIAPIVFIQQYNKQVLAVFSEDDFWERENLIQKLRKELISYESI